MVWELRSGFEGHVEEVEKSVGKEWRHVFDRPIDPDLRLHFPGDDSLELLEDFAAGLVAHGAIFALSAA